MVPGAKAGRAAVQGHLGVLACRDPALGSQPWALCLVAVAVTVALSAGSFSNPGLGMDEGSLVAYPTFVQHGEVPGRDFQTFYGPACPTWGRPRSNCSAPISGWSE